MVDEYTRQPVADGPLHQRSGHRGVHAAGQTADRAPVADLLTHLLDERIGDVRRRPRRVDTREFVQESTENLLTMRVCITSGWYCTPARPLARFSNAATGAPELVATTSKPSGATVTASPWLIHTGWVVGRSE